MSEFLDYSNTNDTDIAIIGMSGRFPGAKNVEEFWQNIREGVESISFFSEAELKAEGIDSALYGKENYIRAKGMLEAIDQFDAKLFGFSPREAELLDPQHRFFLHCAWEALENTGYNPELYSGSIGVYAGAGISSYLLDNLYPNRNPLETDHVSQMFLGNDGEFLPTRVSYKLNLKGPSISVKTACSTSLVAIHLACQSLLNGECDMALAGGVSISVPQRSGYLYKEGMIFSPDGHCRVFDKQAQGTVVGNGLGIVVLKRMEEAIHDRDSIRAIIKGSAVNNDGSMKVSYLAPSAEAQAHVISEALDIAGVEAREIGFVEAHGTGTNLGDPIEIAALTQSFRTNTQDREFCAIGSVKSNIGHLEVAAGVTGLIKTILSLQHKKIPPSLHFQEPNPEIDFKNSPFYVNTRLEEWKTNGKPRRAGVSAFGAGGTNAHIILQEAPSPEVSHQSHSWKLLIQSAKTQKALRHISDNLADHLDQYPNTNLSDVAYTLALGRKELNHRRFLICQNSDEAIGELKKEESTQTLSLFQDTSDRPVVFLFPGQGAQHVNMGLELYQNELFFRDQVKLCLELAEPQLGFSLEDLLYPHEKNFNEAVSKLQQTNIAQPVLFIIEYALAKLWMEWGIYPESMIGHSLGEYVAACLAGVLSLKDALSLVIKRGSLMWQMPHGKMLAVPLSEKKLRPFIGHNLSLAAINGPNLCVISGIEEAINRLQEQLRNQNIDTTVLHTSHAFHSEMMEPILETFKELVSSIHLRPPQIPFLSNLTGSWITSNQATDPNYWSQHLRQTVCFNSGLEQLLKEPKSILLEVGPGRTINTIALRHPDKDPNQMILSSMRHPETQQSDIRFLLTTLGKLWVSGIKVDWERFFANEKRSRIPLPTYPFECQRYWIEAPQEVKENQVVETPNSGKQGARQDFKDWFYIPSWKRSPFPAQRFDFLKTRSSWLILMDDYGIGNRISEELRGAGQDVVVVKFGSEYTMDHSNFFTINAEVPNHYELVLEQIQIRQNIPKNIIHLASITSRNDEVLKHEVNQELQRIGFYSLLFFIKAFGKQKFVKPDPVNSYRITVISNGIQEVTQEEHLSPEKATILGLLKVIPLEYPHIRCHCIDLVLSQIKNNIEKKMIGSLLQELDSHNEDSFIAYRYGYRWVQTFDRINLNATEGISTRFKKKGVYLITGGLGGIGLEVAECLAKTTQPKLILTGRSGLPPKGEWDRWLLDEHVAIHEQYDQFHINIEEKIDHISQLEKEIDEELDIKGIQDYQGLEEILNKLCASYITQYFQTGSIHFEKGHQCRPDEWKTKLNILPAFDKFYYFFLEVLDKEGIIRLNDTSIEVLKDEYEIPTPDLWKEQAERRFPEFQGLFGLLEHCAGKYKEALSGEILAISALYPDGRPDLLNQFDRNTVEHNKQRVYIQLFRSVLLDILKNSPDNRVRILEIGAGNGKLTQMVIPGLKNQNIEYYFTDLGKTFIKAAEQNPQYSGYNFLKFNVLDISKDPTEQGFEKYSFDIIVGLNVVHATKNIEEALSNLKSLMVPRGLLFLLETTESQRWIDMVWGLAEGWWLFEDERTEKNSPLLGFQEWKEVLQKQDFQTVVPFPRNLKKQKETDCGMFVMQQGDEIPNRKISEREFLLWHDSKTRIQNRIRRVKKLEESGAELMVLKADVSDYQQMQEAIRQAQKRFGTINGVIHAAGLPDDGIIQGKTSKKIESIFAPKVSGTLILNDVLKDFQIDFFVLCSTLNSILGGIGLAAHCAANAFLDAFAHYKNSTDGTYTVAINWDAWKEIGQAAEASEKSKRFFVNSRFSKKELLHPLFDHYIEESTERVIYVSYMSVKKHWILNEHYLNNQATLPGTAYLEMARASFENQTGNQMMEIRNVFFLTPLTVMENEEKEIQTILEKKEDGFNFVIKSGNQGKNQWQEHARGEITFLNKTENVKHDIQALKNRWNEQKIRTLKQDDRREKNCLQLGPRWHNVKWSKTDDIQGFAYLELPHQFTDDLKSCKMHPAILDNATSFVPFKNSDDFLPFSYKKLSIKGIVSEKIYSCIRRKKEEQPSPGTVRFGITIMDEQGTEIIEIEEYTLRKKHHESTSQNQNDNLLDSQNKNCRLEIASPGNLDTLTYQPVPHQKPGMDEIEIQVFTAGLNFKDVLTALNIIQPHPSNPASFGLECCGKVRAIGTGVQNFQVGDEVIAVGTSCFSPFVIAPTSSVVHKPKHINKEEASTIMGNYTTTYYALVKTARLVQGERVLIHSAAGGVGLAAVQIAQWIGAEIFATAGNPEKRKYLASLGVQHVMDSRSLSFADEVMKLTENQGVDVVLNSLAGEFIPKSLAVLSRYGRFLEIGKRAILENHQLGLQDFERCLSFFAIEVGPGLPDFLSLMHEIAQHFQEKDFQPLPFKVFPADKIADAFKYMASGKHIGKIVVSFENTEFLRANESSLHVEENAITTDEMITETMAYNHDLNDGLTPQEGIAVLNSVLNQSLPQVIVSTRHLEERISQTSTILDWKEQDSIQKTETPDTSVSPTENSIDCLQENELEHTIGKIWEEFLGVKIGIHQNFFELGGDSLLAIQIVSKLNEILPVTLSPHSLMDLTTIAKLSNSIRKMDTIGKNRYSLQKESSSLLVKIQAGKQQKSPLFLIHAADGYVFDYRDLATFLSADQPIYGIQAQTLEKKERPPIKIEKIATHYIEAIRHQQAEGPYLLGGHSFGGAVAYEIAKQLCSLGEKISLLVMIDTPGIQTTKRESPTSTETLIYLLHSYGKEIKSLEEFKRLETSKQFAYFLEQVQNTGNIFSSMDSIQLAQYIDTFNAYSQALWNYIPQDYPGHILFFRARERNQFYPPNPEDSWREKAKGDFDIYEVPGDHFTMLKRSNVKRLSQKLQEYLEGLV